MPHVLETPVQFAFISQRSAYAKGTFWQQNNYTAHTDLRNKDLQILSFR